MSRIQENIKTFFISAEHLWTFYIIFGHMLFIIPDRISLNKAIDRQLLRHFPLHYMSIEQVQSDGLKFKFMETYFIFHNSNSRYFWMIYKGPGFLATTPISCASRRSLKFPKIPSATSQAKLNGVPHQCCLSMVHCYITNFPRSRLTEVYVQFWIHVLSVCDCLQ